MQMRRAARAMVVAAGLAAGAVAMLPAQTVRVNWREKAPFGDFRTFQVVPAKPDPNVADPFWAQSVPKYLTSALESKGMNPAGAGQAADVKVAYHFRTEEVKDTQTTVDGFGWGGGPWGGWGGWGGWGLGGPEQATTREVPRTMGMLTVDLVETHSNQVVWRGQATEDSVKETKHGDEDQVWKSVGKMFEHYPPKGDTKADK